jgi:hypothetical protein
MYIDNYFESRRLIMLRGWPSPKEDRSRFGFKNGFHVFSGFVGLDLRLPNGLQLRGSRLVELYG